MGLGSRQAGTKFAFFARFCSTGGATNRQGQFLFGLHGYTLHRCLRTRWSIVISSIQRPVGILEYMANIKFVVRVNHGGSRAPAYVQHIGRSPIQMTTNLSLALRMGKLTAEDAAKSLQTSRCIPELLAVETA